MACASSFNVLIALAFFSILVLGTLGDIICEQLEKDECAFSISSSGKRCVLEKYVKRSGEEAHKCTTSSIDANKLKDLIETNHCIESCGLDRDTLGISSDSLLESHFTQKLCSSECYHNCPNIVDLYFNLAAGEGVYLPKLCKTRSENPRRGMAEMKSSGFAGLMDAPAMAPIDPIRFSDAPAIPPY